MGKSCKLWIEGPAGRLEAAFRVAGRARAAAVVAHPHPLQGGTLHNPVVFHTDRELNRAGFSTLRFNFRGVPDSEGSHDDGRGEVQDVASAVSWLRDVSPGLPLFVVGYSFGSWCGVRHAVSHDAVAAVIAIGIPILTFPFPELESLKQPFAVVQGEQDEFGSAEEVRALLRRSCPEASLHVVPGSSHLFPGRAPEAALHVAEAAERLLGALGRLDGA